MAIVTTDNKHYKAIADEVRSCLGNAEKVSPADMPNKVVEVYYAGKEANKRAFWETVLNNLKKWASANKYAFAGKAWDDTTFDPVVPGFVLTPSTVEGFFRECLITDLKGILERYNVTFDFSKGSYFSQFAYSAAITNFPVIDISLAKGNLGNAFAYLKGNNVTLPLKIASEGTLNTFPNNTFEQSTGLTNLIIEGGVIGKTINLQWCPLTLESAISVCRALKNYMGTSEEYAYTVTFSDEVKAMLAENIGYDNETLGLDWLTYINIEKGWNT